MGVEGSVFEIDTLFAALLVIDAALSKRAKT